MAVLVTEGTILQMSISSVLTDIAQVLSIDPPEGKVNAVKKTSLVDTVQRFRAGKMPEGGELKFTIEFDPNNTGHKQLAGRIISPSSTNDDFKIKFVDGMAVPANLTFSGFVTGFKINTIEEENNLEAEVTVQVDGALDYNEGAAS